MKTAISLPDGLFAEADLYAQQQDMSRSKLYAKALAEYLQRHRGEDVTARINDALDKIGDQQISGEGSLDSLRRLPW
jgi:metal-responsive CopG/Arc/MetJ family transcriptional regulator